MVTQNINGLENMVGIIIGIENKLRLFWPND